MTMKRLELVKSKPNESLIKVLQGLLADAESGHITGIACACVTESGRVLTVFGALDHQVELLGGLALVKHRLLRDINE